MEPVTSIIVGAIISAFFAAVIWETLTEFVCRAIEEILPGKYGRKISKYVRKVIGIVRKFGDYAELNMQCSRILRFYY